jgi:hypothetical protein
MALIANIRLSWRGLPGTRTFLHLAYASATDKKKFLIFDSLLDKIAEFIPDL